MRGLLAALAGAAMALSACVTPAPGPPPGPGPVIQPPPASGISPATLPGWAEEDHLAAFLAWSDTCPVARDAAYRAACEAARAAPINDGPSARAFLEAWFVVESGQDEGLLTAYFAPEYEARRARSGAFDSPVLARPLDLFTVTEGGETRVVRRTASGDLPYPARDQIGETTSAPLAWMRAEDLFFMQIQGSGYLTFEDGTRARAAFDGHNGHGFVGIARPMADQGLLPRDGTSGEAIRAWLASHRGAEAQRVMNLNPRYVFFRLDPDDGGHPAGAAGVPLIAGRSVAVDPAHWTYGDLIWIDAPQGDLIGADRGYRGLVTALDTGGAIRGAVRADLYLGRGAAAGLQAGRVRHPLRMWRLTPRG